MIHAFEKIPGKSLPGTKITCFKSGLEQSEIVIKFDNSNIIEVDESKVPHLKQGSRLCNKSKMLVKRCSTAIGKQNASRVLGIGHAVVYKVDHEIQEITSLLPACKTLPANEEILTFPDGTPAPSRYKKCVQLAQRLPDELKELIFLRTLDHFTNGAPINIRDFSREIHQSALEELGMKKFFICGYTTLS